MISEDKNFKIFKTLNHLKYREKILNFLDFETLLNAAIKVYSSMKNEKNRKIQNFDTTTFFLGL